MTGERWMAAKRLAAPMGLGVAVCSFFHRIFLGNLFFTVDFYQTFVPLRSILVETWSRGFPGWTGRLGNGAPVLPNPAYGVLYLPNLVYLGNDPARSMTALTVAHFVAGGVGAWLLARRWGLSRAASWTAAVGFVLSGPAVSSTAFPNLSWPLAWLPLALLAHEEAVRGRTWLGASGLALAWFSMFSMGDPVVLAAALAGSALIAMRDVAQHAADRPWRERLARPLVPLGSAALIALMLASPLVVAIARYLPASVRGAGFKAGGIVQWSLHPLLLAGMALPDAFGDPSLTGPAGFWASALAKDRGWPLLAGLYVGGLIAALAILGALRRSPRRVVLLVWLGLLVILALGAYGPIYPLAGERAGFDALRYPTKWIVPAMLPLALLAASGLDHLAEAASNTAALRRGTAVFLVVLALLSLVAIGSTIGLERQLAMLAKPGLRIDGIPLELHVRRTWLLAAARSAVPLALALVALGVGVRARAVAKALPVIAALATLDVALANQRLAPTVSRAFYDRPRAAEVILGDPAGHERVFVDDTQDKNRPLRYARALKTPQEEAQPQRDGLIAYVGASVGLSLAYNPDVEAFSPIHYARAAVIVHSAPLREKLMLLGAAGATHIVTYHPLEGSSLQPMATIPGAYDLPLLVYRNPLAVPRARIVPRLTPYSSEARLLRALQSAPNDFFLHTALVERQELAAAGVNPETSSVEGGTAGIVAEDGRSLVVQVDGPGGFLVVSDTLAPGWTARVDDAPAALLRADLAFRAVPVPAGSHRVEMRYSPW